MQKTVGARTHRMRRDDDRGERENVDESERRKSNW